MKTGATLAQIEAAAKRYYDAIPASELGEDGESKIDWDQLSKAGQRAWMREFEAEAHFLVPEDKRIVSANMLGELLNDDNT